MLSIRWFKRCPDLHLLVEAAKVFGGAPLTPDGQSMLQQALDRLCRMVPH